MCEVWDVDFDPTVGREQRGIRPAIVISNDAFNRAPHGLRMVVPVTGTDRRVRTHVLIDPPEGGLVKRSFALCDQMRSLSVLRFQRRRGRVNLETARALQIMVGAIIDRRP